MVHPDAGVGRVSVESVLEGALTTVLVKAQRQLAEPVVRTGGLDYGWTGGGAPIVAIETDPQLLEVPFDCYIVWAHMYALDGTGDYISVNATAELRVRQGSGGSSVLSGSGSPPSLSAQSYSDISLSGWRRNLAIGQTVTARLVSFTGTATVVAITMQLRSTEAALGIDSIVDSGGDPFTDSSGDPFVFRS